VTITRNFAGVTSRRSLTSSPILTFSSPSQPGRNLGLDHHLDALKMGSKALARSRWPEALGPCLALVQFRPDGRKPGLDLVEDEGLLLLIQRVEPELLGAFAVARPLQHPDDRRQSLDALVGRRIARLQVRDLGVGRSRLLRHGEDHRLERIHVIGEICRNRAHGCRASGS
jgi:hypothetical protein